MHLAGRDYDEVVATFRWELPERFNIADAIVTRHALAMPERTALIHEQADGAVRTWSYGEIEAMANRLAKAFLALGIAEGDVVGIHLPQSPECLIAHVATLKCGAIVLPLFRLFGPEAVHYRLADSGAKAFITSAPDWERLAPDLSGLAFLAAVVTVGAAGGAHDFWRLIESAADRPVAHDSSADDAAVMIYTSGTTGNPKGALHAHRVLIGHLPGVMLPQDLFPKPGDRFWTPADWAWIGGLLDVLWPSLYCGTPVVASARSKFEPDWAFEFMARHGVRNVFMPPTALRLMRQVPDPRARYRLSLRSLGSGGETLGADLIAWGQEALGVTMHEFYGQTEVNLVVGNCSSLFPVKPGSMGRAIPGHTVEIVDEDGNVLPPGTPGIVAVRRPDPVMFLGYWGKPEATEEKFRGDWCLLGDVAVKDAHGRFWFQGRNDDIINSAGYRIGPGEVEECLMRHPAVKLAGVVGLPDDLRGEVVAAFIVPAEGVSADAALASEIQAFVRERLAAHEYPRIVRFIAEMPMTVTGKVRRMDLRAMGGG